MSGKPPSPPGMTSRNFWKETELADKFVSGIPSVNVSSAALPATLHNAEQRLRWAEHKLDEAESRLELADTPEDKKAWELIVNEAQEVLDDAHDKYVYALRQKEQSVKGKAVGLEETEPLTSAALGKAMGKGRKKKRTTRKKRSQKKWTSSATRKRN